MIYVLYNVYFESLRSLDVVIICFFPGSLVDFNESLEKSSDRVFDFDDKTGSCSVFLPVSKSIENAIVLFLYLIGGTFVASIAFRLGS